MARFVSLNFRAGGLRAVVGAMAGLACFSASLRADPALTATTATAPVPAHPPATNAAPALPPPDTLGRYGKILAPGDETSHPLKLKMPFPGVGEIKVPSQDELNMRFKLEQLAKFSDADIRLQLAQWPAYSKMNLRDEGLMLQRIQDFRDYRSNVAKAKAHAMGLLTLPPDQQARFENEYWNKRLQMDRDLAKQFAPAVRAREQQMANDLFREFSTAGAGPLAQAPKPATGQSPVAPNKPAPTLTSAPSTNLTQPLEPLPMAQGPR